ncbi:hypothetical protein [Modestobacter sp. URMC 112]
MSSLRITPAVPADAGELLTLQRAAFVTEAQVYDDPRLPALVETPDELRSALGGRCGSTGGPGTSSSGASGWTTC